MFIRIKHINGSPYAYLIKNAWTPQGSRQQSTKYLGRVVRLGKVETPFAQPQGSAEEFLTSLVRMLLLKAGFTEDNNKLKGPQDVVVDLTRCHVTRKEKPAVLEINEGFLCALTLRNLLLFKEKKYSQELQQKKLHPGKILAQRIVEAGLQIGPEDFILTFEYLVPNADVLLKYLYE